MVVEFCCCVIHISKLSAAGSTVKTNVLPERDKFGFLFQNVASWIQLIPIAGGRFVFVPIE